MGTRGPAEGRERVHRGMCFHGEGDTHLVFNPHILLTRRTPKQRIDILKGYVGSLWDPIRRPNVRGEARRREDQERYPTSHSS